MLFKQVQLHTCLSNTVRVDIAENWQVEINVIRHVKTGEVL